MHEYPSNSHASKENRETKSNETTPVKKVEKVVSGKVTTRDNKGRKLAGMFFSEDAGSIGSHILGDVLIPATKKVLSDMVKDAIDMLLFGGRGGNSSSTRDSGGTSRVSYRKYYDERDRFDERRDGYSRSRFDYGDIVFDSKGEAETVLDQMLDLVARYGMVTVLDMYELAGIGSKAPYTAQNYGWVSLRTAETVRIRDGYIIKLPKAAPLD